MNHAEKEAYLREYEVLKKKGKPFFPYAVLKDSAMFLIVVLVIVAMSIILGAEQGPKADPTTTTYTPRPEWYFFFLFELLRVIKPPELTPIATIGIPTLCLVLLLLLPFYDRNPERDPRKRPVATIAGIMTIIAMAYLTFLGAEAGAPTEIELEIRGAVRGGQARGRGPGLPRLPQDRRERRTRPGPDLTEIGAKLPAAGDRADPDQPVGDHAPIRRPARRETRGDRRLPRLRYADRNGRQALAVGRRLLRRGPGDVRPHRRRLRPDEHGDDRRPPPRLAHAGRRPGRADRGDSALDLCCGTGDLALELRERVGASGRVVGRRLLRADAGAREREGAGPRHARRHLRVGRRAGAARTPTRRSTP